MVTVKFLYKIDLVKRLKIFNNDKNMLKTGNYLDERNKSQFHINLRIIR